MKAIVKETKVILLTILVGIALAACGGGGSSGEESIENFTLTVEKFGEGGVASNVSGVSCGNDCSESYPSGTTVVLTATADSGSQINSWAGCDSTSGSACTVTMDSDKTVLPTFALSTMGYKAAAVILDDATMQKLVNLVGTTYYFDSTATELSTLQAGDVIASSSGDGLLRRVLSVSTTVDGQYAVETADAALEDVIEQGTITFSRDLTHGDLKAVATASKGGVSLRKAITVSKDFIFDIEDPDTGEALVIYDADGSLATEYDQIRAIGSVTANFTVDVAASIKKKEFKTVLITKTAQDLKVIVGGNIQLINERVSLPRLTFGPFPVSGVIALNIDIAPYVGVEADVNAAVTTRVTLDASNTAGVHYMKGEGWKTIKYFDPVGFDPVVIDATAEARVKGYVGSEFALLLSDTLGAAKGGPFISGEGYLRMNAGAASPFWWKLYGGIGASAGAKLKFLWWSVPDLPEVELYNKEWEIASSDTTSISDTTPPAIPPGLIANAISSSQVNLSWDASTDDTGVAEGYNIYRDGAYLKSVTTLSASDTELGAGTQYCYTVAAYDIAGNESGKSPQICATTSPALDTTPPSIPENLTTTAVSTNQINLWWDASSDEVGVAGYKVYRNGIPIKSVATTSTSDTGLSSDTEYCYTVSAYDAAGSESGQSSSACAVTFTASTTPTVSSVSPSTITQGSSYQNVTIYGSNFTSLSWHEYSVSGGSSWAPATSAPTINSSTSMTIGVNNTVVQTVYFRVCASYGGTACSSSVAVTIQEAASTTPTVSSVLPSTITQGSSYQNVTIYGGNFTSSSWHEFSVSGGSSWAPATSAPTINSSTSMTIGVNNTVVQTVYFRVCASNGSSDCSGSVAVTIQTAAPATPTVSSVSPSTITQGSSYENVTIYGSNFTSSSWHEYSVSGGSSWAPATSAPTINSSTSMTIGVNNTVVQTVYFRVCASYGSTACSSSVAVTIQGAVATLSAPSLSSPFIGSTGVSTTPTFSWSSVSGANRYWLMVATSQSAFPTDPNAISCSGCVVTGTTGLTSHTSSSAFPYGGTSATLNASTLYYWKVQAWNTNGTQGNYSSAWGFITQ